jgi:hypothetical protein
MLSRTGRARANDAAVLNAWLYILASGTDPTEATVSKLCHMSRWFTRFILARVKEQGVLTRGKPIYKSNRLQHVPRIVHWEKLRLVEPPRTSTAQPPRVRFKDLTANSNSTPNPQAAPKPRDDSPTHQPVRRPTEPVTYEQRICLFVHRAIPLLSRTGLDGHSIQSRIWQVIVNAEKYGKIIRSAQYLVVGVQHALAEEEKKRAIIAVEANAGHGPSDHIRTRICTCGRTASAHLRAVRHPERDPSFDGHKFVEAPR